MLYWKNQKIMVMKNQDRPIMQFWCMPSTFLLNILQ